MCAAARDDGRVAPVGRIAVGAARRILQRNLAEAGKVVAPFRVLVHACRLPHGEQGPTRAAIPGSASVSRIHDIGGLHGFGALAIENDEPPFHHEWEARVFAINRFLLEAPAGTRSTSSGTRSNGCRPQTIWRRRTTNAGCTRSKRSIHDQGRTPCSPWVIAVRTRVMNPAGHTRLPTYRARTSGPHRVRFGHASVLRRAAPRVSSARRRRRTPCASRPPMCGAPTATQARERLRRSVRILSWRCRMSHVHETSGSAANRVKSLVAALEGAGRAHRADGSTTPSRRSWAARSPPPARAWSRVPGSRPGFAAVCSRTEMLPSAELGIDLAHWAPVKLRVVANEPGRHNLIVCTLCSCYPLALLGPSPSLVQERGLPLARGSRSAQHPGRVRDAARSGRRDHGVG